VGKGGRGGIDQQRKRFRKLGSWLLRAKSNPGRTWILGKGIGRGGGREVTAKT